MFILFKHVWNPNSDKRKFLKLATVQSDKAVLLTPWKMWLRTQAIEHSLNIEQVARQNVQVSTHGLKRKGAIKRPRNLRIATVILQIYITVFLNDNKKLSCKESGKIRYQLRIQRYIEWGMTLTRKLSKFWV